MTVIAYRDGIVAADSRLSIGSESGGDYHTKCEKLYAIKSKRGAVRAIVGLAGTSSPGLIFLDWFTHGGAVPQILATADHFEAMVLTRKGLFSYDRYCRGERVMDRFYAIGSGAKAALGAMHAGADAKTAAMIACKICPHCGPPIVTMNLPARVSAGASRSG